MDTYTKDVIEVAAWIAIALGVFGSIVALAFSIRATNLQKDALQVSVFNDITARIDKLHAKRPSLKDEEQKEQIPLWSDLTLNTLEHFAFFARMGYLKPEMVDHCQSIVIGICDDINEKLPALADKYRKCPVKGWCSLAAFYEASRGGKPFPLLPQQQKQD